MFSLWNSFTITIIWHRILSSLRFLRMKFPSRKIIVSLTISHLARWILFKVMSWCFYDFQITLGSLISWLSLFCFFQAGIDSNRLVIALEPEAASILCKELQLAKYEDGSDSINVFSPGQRYLVLDAGGKNKTTLQKLNKIC